MAFETLPGIDVPLFTADVFDFGGSPINVIRTTDEWHVHVHWHTTGSLSPYLPGYWLVNVFLESIGPGQELRLDGVPDVNPIPLTPGPGEIHYFADVKIPAGTVIVPSSLVDPHGKTVPMKLVTTITYLWCDDTPGPMAGYLEGPILQFFNPKK